MCLTSLKRIGLFLLCCLVVCPSAAFGQVPVYELEEVLTQLEIELLNSKDLLQNQRNTLANLRADLKASEKTIRNLETSIGNLEIHISELQTTITLLKAELENSKRASREALISLDEAKKSLNKQTIAIVGISVVALTFLGTTIYLALK